MSSENETQTTESCKEDFVKWNMAVNLQAAGEYQEALQLYHSMHDITARIYYNMAAAYINVGDIGVAIKCLTSAVRKDKGLAIAFFQRGTLYLECKNIKDAISDLETTRMLFRGNTFINYRPLGLFCYLHDFAILYNLALAHLLEGDDEKFRILMTEATHNADHFQREQISGTMILFKNKRWSEIQPINVTTDAVFVPPKQVTKNLERKKRSSKRSKVIFASDENANTPTFQGVQRLEELRRSLQQSENLTDHQTSMKRKLFRKLKSTGDINAPAAVHRYDSPRRKRFSSESSESTLDKSNTLSNSSFKNVGQIQQSCSPNAFTNSTGDKITNEMPPHKKQYSKVDSEVSEFQNDVANAVTVSIEEKIQDINSENTEKSNRAILVEEKVSDQKKMISHGKGTFTSKAKSLGDIKSRAKENKTLGKWKSSRSAGDLGKESKRPLLPLERKQKSKTSSSSLKRMLNPKVKAGSFKTAPDGSHPTVVMDGFKAAGALLAMFVPVNSSEENEFETDNVRVRDKLDMNNNDSKVDTFSSKSKYSLGSVFGDRSTVVKYALTEACDVLTAAVTPTIDESEVNGRNKNELKQSRRDVPSLVRNEQTVVKSKKKKRAPDPPMSVIKPHLFAATQLITAVVHQEFGQTTGGLSEGTADAGSSLYAESSCRNNNYVQRSSANHRQTECQSFSDKRCQKSNEAHMENTTTQGEQNTLKLKESTMNAKNNSEHSDVRGSEIVFEDINKVNPCQNLTLQCETFNKTFLTPRDTQSGTEQKTSTYENIVYLKKNKLEQNTKERLDSVVLADNINQNTSDNSGRGFINQSVERYNESNVFMGSKHSSRKAKVPPPSYPPPPLRPFYWKKQKQSKRRQPKTELGGMIGNALISSGQVLGVVVDTEINNVVRDSKLYFETNKHKKTVFYRRRGLEAEIPKEGDHDYVNVAGTFRKCGETSTSMTERRNNETNTGDENEACEICSDSLITETVHSSKKDRSDLNDTVCAPFKHLTLGNDVLAPNACSCLLKRKTKQESETKNKVHMLMTSCDLLTAFVTSNQETRQAFEAFVEKKRGSNDQQNIASYDAGMNHETDHDYVNISRL